MLFCLRNKEEGDPLERGRIDFSSLSEVIRKSSIYQVGEILTIIHTIKFDGNGWVIGKGKTVFSSVHELLTDF